MCTASKLFARQIRRKGGIVAKNFDKIAKVTLYDNLTDDDSSHVSVRFFTNEGPLTGWYSFNENNNRILRKQLVEELRKFFNGKIRVHTIGAETTVKIL